MNPTNTSLPLTPAPIAAPVSFSRPAPSYAPVPLSMVHFKIPPPPVKGEHTRLIDFRGNERDWNPLVLKLFGFTHKAVAITQGISVGQVAYRLKKFNANRPPELRVSAKSYRDGTSPIAQRTIEALGREVKAMLAPAVRDTHYIEV